MGNLLLAARGARAERGTRYQGADGSLPIVALGLMVVMASLAIGVGVAETAGHFWAQDAAARAADHVRAGRIASTGAWNTVLVLFGISLLMTSVVVVLQRVIGSIKERGNAMSSHLPVLLQRTGGR